MIGVLLGLGWSGGALAAPSCAPLDENEFRGYVLDAQSAIDRGDIEVPAAILHELDDRFPCLTFAPAPRMWAELLVARAIVEFSRGGDWQDPLAEALRIRPMIDRGVGPGHPLAHWEPPPPPPTGKPLPEGVRLYVDGFLSPTEPPTEGLHLVQKTDGTYWNSIIIHDTSLPAGWTESPVELPARVLTWGRVGLLSAFGSFQQNASWPSDVWEDVDHRVVRGGVVGDIQATFYAPVGVRAHGAVTLGSSVWIDGWIAAVWAPGGFTFGLGAGQASVSQFESQFGQAVGELAPIERVERLPYGLTTLGLRSRGGARWDVGLTGGGSPALVRAMVDVGLLLPPIGGGRYRIGLALDARRAVYVQAAAEERTVTLSGMVVGLELDLVRGAY